MWNNGFFLLWSHIAGIYDEDLESGLKLVNKLISDHIKLTSYSVMRVNLAAQVLSKTVGNVLNNFDPEEAAGTGKFCLMMDKFFDCLNVGNTKEHVTKQIAFLKPYESIDDVKFVWLDEFLNYFNYGKIQLKKEMTQFIVTRQSQKCLFHGNVMKDCKSLFFLSKNYASFCYNKVFHIFYLKDFVKMIWKIILRNSVSLTEGVIIQMFVISAIMTI